MSSPFYIHTLISSDLIRWGSAALASPVTITYSFPTSMPDIPGNPSISGFTTFSDIEKNATLQALAMISSFTKITFTQVAASDATADIRFGNANLANAGAPTGITYYSYGSGGLAIADIFLDTSGPNSIVNDAFIPGSITSDDINGVSWSTLLHEIGHALGLKHPFVANLANDPASILASGLDHVANSVMSYTGYSPANVAIVTGTAESYSYFYNSLYPTTFGLYDIAALQYLYGANTSSAGNKTFTFQPDAPVIQTIFDAGPNNTINVSALSGANTIDLTPGARSALAIRQSLPFGLTIPEQYDGSAAFSIAYGVLIANVFGGSGADMIQGNAAANYLVGGGGADTLHGDAGGDTLAGGAGDDQLFGGTGVDYLAGGDDNDTLYGGDEGDALHGQAGDDTIYGEGGADVLIGLTGNNILDGGDGADTAIGDSGNDTIIGGAGGDQLYGYGGVDTLSGGAGGDTIIDGSGDSTLNGDGDNDQMYGYGGADTLDGGAGLDFLSGGSGADILRGGAGGDVLDGEDGDDQLFAGDDGDNLNGGAGNDIVNGEGGADGLLGGIGDDTLNGGAGNDFMIGGDGNDTFVFTPGTGSDLVVDFQAGAGVGDVLDVRAFSFASFSAVMANASDVGGGTFIALAASDFIFLQNVATSQLSPNDFALT